MPTATSRRTPRRKIFWKLVPRDLSFDIAGAEDVELPTLSAPVLLFELGVLSVAGAPVKRLILTSLSGTSLVGADRAEIVVPFAFRFAWGPLPPADELAALLGPRLQEQGSGDHWSDYVDRWHPGAGERQHLALVEFCEPYETIELWFDPHPNDQLQLVWLLDYFRIHPRTAAKLVLRLVDFDMMVASEEELGSWRVFD